MTNRNNRSGSGAHSALIIAASETVVFNPAGTWWHPEAPERGDLHHGFSPAMERWFVDYHARETYRVEIQRRAVSPEAAEAILARARDYGTATESLCTIAVSRVLSGAPEFEDFPVVLMPGAAQEAFARYPGVTLETYRDDSPGDRSDLIAVTAPQGTEGALAAPE